MTVLSCHPTFYSCHSLLSPESPFLSPPSSLTLPSLPISPPVTFHLPSCCLHLPSCHPPSPLLSPSISPLVTFHLPYCHLHVSSSPSFTTTLPVQHWSQVSTEAKDLISHLLVKEVDQRYTALQVLDHSWVQERAPKTPLHTPRILSRLEQPCTHHTVAHTTLIPLCLCSLSLSPNPHTETQALLWKLPGLQQDQLHSTGLILPTHSPIEAAVNWRMPHPVREAMDQKGMRLAPSPKGQLNCTCHRLILPNLPLAE